MYEIIRRKRDGLELTTGEINRLVEGIASGAIPDYQVAAWLMAVYFRGMSSAETAALTSAMVTSGETLDLSGVQGVIVDKHSTGGVGDKTTLVLAPLVAAAGVPVAKMSGRGLGHTGGTLDKLECFPGIRLSLSPEQLTAQVNEIGIAITGQTADLVPADRLLYALRDVTATVDSVPLIAASVMSKKLAVGADAVVLDVKTGSGAFMKEIRQARELAQAMVDIALRHGRRAVALVTDMSQPLGRAVGNALEVKEAIGALRGEGPADLTELCLALGAEMLVLAGAAPNLAGARETLAQVLASGAALKKLAQMVAAQGGDPSFIHGCGVLPCGPECHEVLLHEPGFVSSIDALAVGLVAMRLGAGRQSKADQIDHAVGVEILRKTGDYVAPGEVVALVYARSASQAAEAAQRLSRAFQLTPEPPAAPGSLVLERIADLRPV
jgi:pyrimidine-nucleoside phosphorylase